MVTLTQIIATSLQNNDSMEERLVRSSDTHDTLQRVISGPELLDIMNSELSLEGSGGADPAFVNLVDGIRTRQIILTPNARNYLLEMARRMTRAGYSALPKTDEVKPWEMSALLLNSLDDFKKFLAETADCRMKMVAPGVVFCEGQGTLSDLIEERRIQQVEAEQEVQEDSNAQELAQTVCSRENVVHTTEPGGLRVNLDAAQHYKINKSERAGIDDLLMLAGTSDVEEGWIFVQVKSRDGKTKNVWYEVGYKETRTSTAGNTEAFIGRIKADLLPGDVVQKVAAYHLHPGLNRYQCETQSLRQNELFPSDGDWRALQLQHQFVAENFPDAEISNFAVDDRGVWQIQFDDSTSVPDDEKLQTDLSRLSECLDKTENGIAIYEYETCTQSTENLRAAYLYTDEIPD